MLHPAEWFVGLSAETAIFLLSMIPVTELRASIPIGIEVYGLPVWKVWVIAVLGDMLPALFILYLIPFVHSWVAKTKFCGGLLTTFLGRAEAKFQGKHAKYGAIGLIVFVGIPLPLTGSWTGSLAAFVFNIPFRQAALLIFFGVCMAATLVTLITLGAGGTLRFFF